MSFLPTKKSPASIALSLDCLQDPPNPEGPNSYAYFVQMLMVNSKDGLWQMKPSEQPKDQGKATRVSPAGSHRILHAVTYIGIPDKWTAGLAIRLLLSSSGQRQTNCGNPISNRALSFMAKEEESRSMKTLSLYASNAGGDPLDGSVLKVRWRYKWLCIHGLLQGSRALTAATITTPLWFFAKVLDAHPAFPSWLFMDIFPRL
ncbi:hypothetical protein GQ43DRAFT_432664 [Delitschia confertaspora ATCC 74209]|uniref:Uncharacterized protein n=1 Tax=Delitschia confertaspora ATCC 74209 TaxID=1513339 RepID=A0A9P4JIX2_9PLEO|nr:hypothetical protein GQ43DRAFT_432664 [Delitschia confertaspora ATCC 74209]